MHNERDEEVHEICINNFSEILWGKWAILCPKPKNGAIVTSLTAVRIFLKILRNERSQEVDQNYVNGFSGKNSSGKVIFFKFNSIKKTQQLVQNHFIAFSEILQANEQISCQR